MKLPELKRRFKNKYVIRIAAGVLTIAVAGGSAGVYTVNAAKTSTKAETTQESTDKKDKKDNKDDEEDLKEVLSSKISKAADEEVGKEETVYVVADNSAERRILKRVIMDDETSSEIDLTFTTLMGDKVEPRREFIEANAKYVKNLDV